MTHRPPRRSGPARRASLGAIACLLMAAVDLAPGAAAAAPAAPASPPGGCELRSQAGAVQHVVNIVFDNTHFTRDDPNVPSDLEQMPNLLGFITGNGTLVSHAHTSLIAHTATNILTGLTGLYGDRMGAPVSNGFGFYDTNAFASFRSTFDYWTARLGGKNDNTFFMTTPAGLNTPAPWVPYTRAGCSFGAVATANTVLENTGFDIPAVFGVNSPENKEQQDAFNIPCGFGANPPCTPAQRRAKAQPQADFVGLAIHCGAGDAACAGATGARPDVLPDEPGGYAGFSGLFGAKYVSPFISPSGPATDLAGNVIADPTGNPGFPGFDAMFASTSLGLVAAMQEHGVPVTTAYISDAHDNHAVARPFGPGEAGYVQALKAYDDAFGQFFRRLSADGITKDNTLFTFTSDEGDHFAGGPGVPAGCDGVTTPCTYPKIGELDVNLSGLLSTVPPYSTGTPVPAMSVHSDSAPTVYLNGNPSQTDAVTRTAERAAKRIEATNAHTGEVDRITNYLAGVAAMRNLHMLTGDPARDPTFTLFADPDYFICATGFACPEVGNQVVVEKGFAWNHGTVAPEINTTWLGLVGPGVRSLGVDGTTWSSQADLRPTDLALLGLRDDYEHQGRVLVELIDRHALGGGFGNVDTYAELARVYSQLDSPVGQFGLATLRASTAGLASGTPQNDSVYTSITDQLAQLGQQRDDLAGSMAAVLDRPVSTAVADRDHDDGTIRALEQDGLALLQRAWLLAGE